MSCPHYHSELDNVQFQFGCCTAWFGCYQCHLGHPHLACKEDAASVRCVCGESHTPAQYRARAQCRSGCQWNPGCKQHWHHYFETTTG
ncbi:MAG: hypothetical protein ACPHK8_02165 [Thermoplasmatota archaeon]